MWPWLSLISRYRAARAAKKTKKNAKKQSPKSKTAEHVVETKKGKIWYKFDKLFSFLGTSWFLRLFKFFRLSSKIGNFSHTEGCCDGLNSCYGYDSHNVWNGNIEHLLLFPIHCSAKNALLHQFYILEDSRCKFKYLKSI